MIRLLLADDQEMFRQGLVYLLSTEASAIVQSLKTEIDR